MNSVPGPAPDGRPIVLEWPNVPSIGLNYYDGRFLRASDLNLEHQSLRGYSDLGVTTGGTGVVRGLDFSVDGGTFTVGAGLAVDGRGQLLNLPEHKTGPLADLLATARPAPGSDTGSPATTGDDGAFVACGPGVARAEAGEPVTVAGTALYVVTISRQQVPYGQADVLGRLCDEACVGPTDSPYVVDGIALSVLPMGPLALPDPGDGDPTAYLRSRVASGWFARERGAGAAGGSLLGRGGLRSATWGRGATTRQPVGVPLAVLGWDGSAVTLLDTWTVRRERMEAPAPSYWSGRLERRPWPVFLAQVLQFQAQLVDSGLVGAPLPPEPETVGPGDTKRLVDESWRAVDRIATMLAEIGASSVDEQMSAVRRGLGALQGLGGSTGTAPTPRALPDLLVDTPPAGYLPVSATSGIGLRRELETWFGGAVDLRVCAVGRDQIAGELDSARHLDRISLLPQAGPGGREPVDVLVPDGSVQTTPVGDLGLALSVGLGMPGAARSAATRDPAADPAQLLLEGVARVGTAGAVTMRAAAAGTAPSTLKPALEKIKELAEGRRGLAETAERFSQNDFGTDGPSAALLREDGARVERSMVVARAHASATPPPATSRSLGASASLWLASDPFALRADEQAAFHAEWETALGSGSEAVSVVADGWARRGATASGTGGPETSFLLVGALQVVTGVGPHAPTRRTNLRETVWLARTSDGGQESVLARDDADRWHARIDWGGRPTRATALVTATNGTVEVQVADVAAAEDPTIEQAGEAHRDAALAGLQIVSLLHPDDPGFVERGFADLFPSDSTGLDSVVVPVTDWVLFRRRTWRACESGVATPEVGTSTVAAWVVRARDAEQAGVWTREVRTSPNPDVPWPKAPILVRFETGTSLLRSGANAWRAELESLGVGALVEFAGYARTASSTEGAVGVGRAQAVVDAGDPVLVLADDGVVDLVANPPASQLLPDTQGSLFVITYDTAEPVDVVALSDLDDDQRKAVLGGDVGVVAALPAAQTELVAQRADVDGIDADLRTTVSTYVKDHGDGKETWVLWIRGDLPDPRRRRVRAGATHLRTALSVPKAVPDVEVRPDAGTDLPSIRAYVLLTTQNE
jgi:hypothetical protein